MEEQFLPYEEALALKELGFKEECICGYNSFRLLRHKISSSIDGDFVKWDNKYDKDLKAPLWQQAFDWFRNEHNLPSLIEPVIQFKSDWEEELTYNYNIYTFEGKIDINVGSYEEAKLDCLRKLIEIVKNNGNRFY